jgi:hypothetical protein
MIDRSKILTRAKLKNQDANTLFLGGFMRNFGGNLHKTFEGVDETVLEFGDIQEFEFDGFSVVVEDGVFAVQYEDSEDGLVIQNLVGENETLPEFPYLFEVNGVEKIYNETDYQRIKNLKKKKK